jgi:hypothetical protein
MRGVGEGEKTVYNFYEIKSAIRSKICAGYNY